MAFRQDCEWLQRQRGVDVWVLRQIYIEVDTSFGKAIQAELDKAANPTAKRWWKTIYQHALGLARENDIALAYMHCLQKHLMWQTKECFFADGIDCDSLCFFNEGVRDRVYRNLDSSVWQRKNM